MRTILEKLGVRSATNAKSGAGWAEGARADHASDQLESGARWIDVICRRVSFNTLERTLYGAIGLILLAGCVVLFGAKPPAGGGQEAAGAAPAIVVAAPLSSTPAPAAPRAETAKAAEPQAAKTAEPQAAKTAEPQTAKTAEPQTAKTAEPQTAIAAPATAPARPRQAETPAAPMPSIAPLALASGEDRAAAMSRTMFERTIPQSAPEAAPAPDAQANAAPDEASAQPDEAAAPVEPRDADKARSGGARAKSSDERATGEHVSRCFVKVTGRVLHSGSCRISRKGQAVSLQFAGSGVLVSPHRGKEWTLTVSGRNAGKVYKASGGCWGTRNHTYVCERGV